jgi:FkbM family methyltransferase
MSEMIDTKFRGFHFTVVRGDFTENAAICGYEEYVFSALLKDMAKVNTAVDVGANIGLLAVPMAATIAPGGKVYCLEISQRNCKLLLRNARRNNLDNLLVLPIGASDNLGSTLMAINGATTLQSLSHVAAMGEGADMVLAAPLDMLFGKVDLIKIDTDGYEYPVLTGAKRLLSTCKPIIYLEYCPPLSKRVVGVDGEEILRLLAGLDYRATVLHRAEPAQEIEPKALIETVTKLWQRDWDAGITHLDIRWH